MTRQPSNLTEEKQQPIAFMKEIWFPILTMEVLIDYYDAIEEASFLPID